ncbi:hypothetical protein VTO73DRAFT_2940 [Trametes versicolor]
MAQFRAEDCVNLAAFTLVLFEHLTTLDREVRLVRRRRLSYAGAVFLLNRYLALLLFFLSLGPLLPTHNTMRFVCRALNYATQMVVIALYLNWSAFSGLRIYAISGQNDVVTWAVVVISSVPAIINIYIMTRVTDAYRPGGGCIVARAIPQDTWIRLAVATRACFLLSETIVFAVTYMKTCTMVFLNATGMVGSFAASYGAASCLSSLLNAILVTMVSRFYFHLNDLSTGEEVTPIPTKQSEDLVFVRTFPTTASDEPPTPPPKDRKWLLANDVLHIRPLSVAFLGAPCSKASSWPAGCEREICGPRRGVVSV